MVVLLAILLLGINFMISWSNASYVGRYWTESKKVGGSFRAYVVCGYVMAICGFTMVYGYILLLVTPVVLTIQDVDPELIARFQSLAADWLYLLVAIPVVLSGFRIWITSLRRAWEERTFSYIATAGWNSYAQIHNTISVARNAPSAFKHVTEALFGGSKSRSRSSKKNDGLVVMLALAVVVLALLGGFFTANAIMKQADAEYDLFEDAYQKHLARG